MPWWFPYAVGLEDGVNPCALITCAAIMALRLWTQGRGIPLLLFLLFWIIPMAGINLVLNLGYFQNIFFSNVFVNTATCVYFVLAAAFLVLGIVFLNDWSLVRRGKEAGSLWSGRIFCLPPSQPRKRMVRDSFLILMVAVFLGVLSSLWPPHAFITLHSGYLAAPGKFWPTLTLVATYTLMQLWLAIFFIVLLSWDKLSFRLRHIIHAAVFLSAAGAVFYFFLGKGLS